MIDQHAIFIVHGVLASLAWVIFFPLGAVLMRTLNGPSTWKIHAVVQIFAMSTFTAAVGTGLQMATKFKLLDNYHVVIGLVLFAVVFLQALGGFLHHVLFKKHQRRTVVSHVHLWLGRMTITLGMINGGLGLYANKRTKRADWIIYGVVAGVVWFVWVVISAVQEARRGSVRKNPAREGRRLARERRVEQRESRTKFSQKRKSLVGEKGDWV